MIYLHLKYSTIEIILTDIVSISFLDIDVPEFMMCISSRSLFARASSNESDLSDHNKLSTAKLLKQGWSNTEI